MFLDRGFAIKLADRFESCQEFRVRLQAILELAYSVERDPIAVGAEIAKRLERHDQQTIRAIYARNVAHIGQELMTRMNTLHRELHRNHFEMQPYNPRQIELPNGFEVVSHLASFAVALAVHHLLVVIRLSVAVKGNECAFLCNSSKAMDSRQNPGHQHPRPVIGRLDGRQAPAQMPDLSQVESESWETLFWFDGSVQQDPRQFVEAMDASVCKAMRRLEAGLAATQHSSR